MAVRTWSLALDRRKDAESLASAIGTRPIIAQLLINRGIELEEQARLFLNPKLAQLRTPQTMAGYAQAVERLTAAVLGDETIGIFGDYDVDGVSSCALLTSFLRDVSSRDRVVPRVASRDAGYGFGVADVEHFRAAGARVIVTCDCGTSDYDALE